MKLKPNFIPRSLCTSILAKFFFASIHLLLALIQSHINVCLLFSEYFKNILMLIATQARSFFILRQKLVHRRLAEFFTLKVIICQLTAAAFTQNEFLTGLFLSLSQNLARFLISDKFPQVKKDQAGGIHLNAKQRISQRQKEYSTTE